MSIALHTFCRKGNLIDYVGKHDNGAVCILTSGMHDDGATVCCLVWLNDTIGANKPVCPVPPFAGCSAFETQYFEKTGDALSALNKWIDEHPLLNYLTEMPEGYSQLSEEEGYVEFTPGEEPTPEQVVDSNLASM